MCKVIAGIVTFNPNIIRLKKNIESISSQVMQVCIVDNCSKNIMDICELKKIYNVHVIKNLQNNGIAYALNQIMEYAKNNKYEWCVTLDQDSVSPMNLISEAKNIFEYKNIGQIVPTILEDRTNEFCYLGTKLDNERFQKVSKSITSASINNVYAWEKCGRFDDDLFIDYVDYDYCMKLRKANFEIYRMNYVVLNHQIGDSFNVNLFGFKVRVGNHSAFRKYYMGRNIVIYINRYKNDINCVKEYLRLIKIFLLILFFENNKFKKVKSFLCGINDVLKYIDKYKKKGEL